VSLRQLQKANTRSKIKAIAKRAFLEQGIEATSTRYLSEQAGIAVGTLFVHFPDKLSLVKDIFFDEMDVALRAAVVAQKASSSPMDYLQQMAQVLFDFYDEYVEFTRQVLLDSLAKGGFHTNQMAVISDGIVKRFKQVGVDDKTAGIFAENMMSNYWFVLLSGVPKGALGVAAMTHLERMNLPFEMSYRNALKNKG
jgi:AcrR family transcriptional regulator